MFYFMLNPLYWEFDSDGETVYRAIELADGSYLVSFKTDKEYFEIPYTQEEVTLEMAKGAWIITNENGEMTT
jgi:hypothetical protein